MPLERDELLESVPFGRSRALRLMGSVLLGAAVQLTAPRLARAAHGTAPYPCFNAGECHCCDGSAGPATCCESGCTRANTCNEGWDCWYTCPPGATQVYRCCDWNSSSGLCICSELTQLQC